MAFPLLSSADMQRLNKVLPWAERQMGIGSDADSPHSEQRQIEAIRGYLLQDVYRSGSGLMQLVYRAVQPNATKINIVGTNYVVGSKFKLNLYGTVAGDTNAASLIIATTPPIPVKSTATSLQKIIVDTCRLFNLPVTKADITVDIGNPVATSDLILNKDPLSQPEVDATTTPPQSYVGAWIVTVNGNITRAYTDLNFQVLQDTDAIMKGVSAVVSEATVDLPSDSYEVVQDVFNRPPDFPWKAGSLCVAIPFLTLGYGIIASDFRVQTTSLPTSSS